MSVVEQDLQAPFELASDAREVLLVRHGAAQHDDGVQWVDERWADPGLTDRGHDQARLLADRLAAELSQSGRPLLLVASGLRRTDETVAPVAAALQRDVTTVPDLREVSLGEYEGTAFEQARRGRDLLLARVLVEQRWELLPGAESASRFAERVAAGLQRVVTLVGPGGTAVVVTHGGVVAEVCRQITGSRPCAFVSVENASVTRLVRARGGDWTLRGFNDVSHLGNPGVNTYGQ